jgi:hypothetical protein
LRTRLLNCPSCRLRLCLHAEAPPAPLCRPQTGAGSLSDQPAFLLRQRRIQVQNERISLTPEIRDDELDSLRHQPADEVHVAAQAVEFCHYHRCSVLAGRPECGGELRPAVDGVASLARLNFGERLCELEPLSGLKLTRCLPAKTHGCDEQQTDCEQA